MNVIMTSVIYEYSNDVRHEFILTFIMTYRGVMRLGSSALCGASCCGTPFGKPFGTPIGKLFREAFLDA